MRDAVDWPRADHIPYMVNASDAEFDRKLLMAFPLPSPSRDPIDDDGDTIVRGED